MGSRNKNKRFLSYCKTGDLNNVKKCANKGTNIHARNEYALQLAVLYGHLNVVQYLVSLGVDIHADDGSILGRAAWKGHLNVIQYLVSLRVNIHVGDESALQCAVGYGHLNVVQYLISSGAIIKQHHKHVIKYVHKNGILVNGTGIDVLQREYDKIKFIENALFKLIHIKQAKILLNANSFMAHY